MSDRSTERVRAIVRVLIVLVGTPTGLYFLYPSVLRMAAFAIAVGVSFSMSRLLAPRPKVRALTEALWSVGAVLGVALILLGLEIAGFYLIVCGGAGALGWTLAALTLAPRERQTE